MDIKKIQTLIEMIKDSHITQVEINEGEKSIRINRYSAPAAVPMTASTPVVAPSIVKPVTPAIASVAESVTTEQAQTNHTIKSPMVGTFYRAASTNGAPFVEVGHAIAVGDTLCIIEAMKILNQIETDRNGIIKQILVDDGQGVEFEQALFIIE